MAQYADLYRDMQTGDLIQGLKTTNWYKITAYPGERSFGSETIAIGPDNCGRHHIGKSWEADRWTDSKVLYQKVAEQNYHSLAVGDILVGKSTGAIYRITTLDDNRREFRAKVIAHREYCSTPIGCLTEPRGFDHGAYTLYREYGKSPTIQPTNPADTGTTTTKENPVNTENITKAINDLVAEDTAKEVRPIYRAIAKLVGSVRRGEALVIINPLDETYSVRDFIGRMNGKDSWRSYDSGSMSTDEVVSYLTKWKAGNSKLRITRLTPHKG